MMNRTNTFDDIPYPVQEVIKMLIDTGAKPEYMSALIAEAIQMLEQYLQGHVTTYGNAIPMALAARRLGLETPDFNSPTLYGEAEIDCD